MNEKKCSKMIFIDDHSKTLPKRHYVTNIFSELPGFVRPKHDIYDFCRFLLIQNETGYFGKIFFVTQCLFWSVLECSSIQIIFEQNIFFTSYFGVGVFSVNAKSGVFSLCSPSINGGYGSRNLVLFQNPLTKGGVEGRIQ